MGALQDDTALTQQGGRLTATLSRDWEIWGPNGGYLAAIALRAAGRAVPEGHRPATFSCQYLSSPPFGEVELRVEPARRRRQAWCLNVAMIESGRTHLQAQVWTTNRVAGPDHAGLKPPAAPPPAPLKPIEAYMPEGHVKHRFWQNIDSKPVRFAPPGTPDLDGDFGRQWFKLVGFDAGGDPFLDCAQSLVMIDTLIWPTFWRTQPEPPSYIAPSLDLTVRLHEAPGASAWLLLDVQADAAKAGLIAGGARVWSGDGRLLATGGSQLLVVDR